MATFADEPNLTLRRPGPPLFIVLLLWCLPVGGQGTGELAPTQPGIAPGAAQDSTIRKIHLYGNRVTNPGLIMSTLQIDSGMVFDTILVQAAKERLRALKLFTKVDIVHLCKGDGIHLYVIVNEQLYLSISDLGGELGSYKYNEKQPWWHLRLRVGVSYANFRGRKEEVRTAISVWDSRALALSWSKPLLPSPYYLGVAGSVDQRPDEYRPTDYTDLAGRATFGRTLLGNSRTYVSVIPAFRRQSDTTGNEMLRSYEAFGALGWATDLRSSTFDPTEGWYLATEARSNYIHAGENTPYVQGAVDLRAYAPGPLGYNRIAMRAQAIVRNTDAGAIHRIQVGGDETVRGYDRRRLGLFDVINDALLLSMEYRFPLYSSPVIEVPLVSAVYSSVTSVRFRIDGAFIFDYARLATDLGDLFRADGAVEKGTGIGLGLRLHIPTIQQSGCLDVVWGDQTRTKPEAIDFLKQVPKFHLYAGMVY